MITKFREALHARRQVRDGLRTILFRDPTTTTSAAVDELLGADRTTSLGDKAYMGQFHATRQLGLYHPIRRNQAVKDGLASVTNRPALRRLYDTLAIAYKL